MKKTKSLSKTGYICADESLKETWREMVLPTDTLNFTYDLKKNIKRQCVNIRKVKVTLTLTVEDVK